MTDKTAIRNASTIIVVKDRYENPSVLMGQRGSNAAFMPNKFVFPGGAMDEDDASVALASPIPYPCYERLAQDAATGLETGLVAAAIRELWEETGLILGQDGQWPVTPPSEWQSFADQGFVPSGQGLQFVFRAITPPGRPRRFDARFFLADARHIQSDLNDFSNACDELSHLQWIPIDQARSFDLPFITEVVLAEVAKTITDESPPESVPFFRNNDEDSLFMRLYGRPLTD